MLTKKSMLKVRWQGPFGWPGYEGVNGLPPVPKVPGVYLLTFEYENGYIIYCAGFSGRSVPDRLREHTREFMNGRYNVLDVEALRQGSRVEVWHGWGYARQHRDEFERRKQEILEAVRKELAAFRVFVAALPCNKRLLERLEAAIMDALYEQLPPISIIPDQGMHLSRRKDGEEPIIVENVSPARLYGLPSLLQI